MSKIDVFFVTPVFEKASTGPAVYALYLWQYFKNDSDISFQIVTANSDIDHPRVHNLRPASRSGPGFYDPMAQRALSLAQASERPTIIHGNSTHTMAACLGCDVPLVVQVNDYETAEVLRHPLTVLHQSGWRRLMALIWRRHRERSVLAAADHAICNSDFVRRRVLESYRGLDAGKLTVIYKAVETGHFERPAVLPPDPWGEAATGLRILTVGTNWRLKGVPELIEAVATVKRAIPALHLMIVGPSSPADLDAIEKLGSAAGVSGDVTIAGRVGRDRLASYYWHADLYAQPSHAEAFGVAVLEAMASGLPVVCSNVGGLPEIVRDEDDGLTVPAGDPAALAAALRRLAENQTRRETLARRGPERAAAFSAESMVARLRNFYMQFADA